MEFGVFLKSFSDTTNTFDKGQKIKQAIPVKSTALLLDEKDIEIGLLLKFICDFFVGEQSCDNAAVGDEHYLDVSAVTNFIVESA